MKTTIEPLPGVLLILHTYIPRPADFRKRLHPSFECFSLRSAESSSSSYGPYFYLRLLSTLLHSNAATFGYQERASLGRGFTPLCVLRLPATTLIAAGSSAYKNAVYSAPKDTSHLLQGAPCTRSLISKFYAALLLLYKYPISWSKFFIFDGLEESARGIMPHRMFVTIDQLSMIV